MNNVIFNERQADATVCFFAWFKLLLPHLTMSLKVSERQEEAYTLVLGCLHNPILSAAENFLPYYIYRTRGIRIRHSKAAQPSGFG